MERDTWLQKTTQWAHFGKEWLKKNPKHEQCCVFNCQNHVREQNHTLNCTNHLVLAECKTLDYSRQCINNWEGKESRAHKVYIEVVEQKYKTICRKPTLCSSKIHMVYIAHTVKKSLCLFFVALQENWLYCHLQPLLPCWPILSV